MVFKSNIVIPKMQKDYYAIVGLFSIAACKVISPNLPYVEQFDSAPRIISMI